MIDTHAHLDGCEGTPAEVVQRAAAAGVGRIVTVGTSLEGAREALAMADALPGVWAAVGVHPHRAGEEHGELERIAELHELLRHPKAVAVGETGLDWFRDYAPAPRQHALFAAQLAIAAETGKPVVIHTRAADDDTAAHLRDHPGQVILHCFSSPALLDLALEKGWYISFAGNVSYPPAADLRRAAYAVPAERILVETDCPYLAPQAVRGKKNEPAYVMHTLAALAQARGEDADELEARIEANAARVFGLPAPAATA